MDRDFLIDLFAEFGPVTVRRMFSGYGVSVGGTNFAMVLRDAIFFRADQENVPAFEAEDMGPFQYQQRTSGKTVTVNSYWKIPDRLYDDSEELARWARAALAAAQRAAVGKSPRAKRNSVRRKAAAKVTALPRKRSPPKPSRSKLAKQKSTKTTAVKAKITKPKISKPGPARPKPTARKTRSKRRAKT